MPLVQSDSSSHVPFPTDTTRRGDARVSHFSTNSESTSSDKLSALPGPSSSPNARNRAGHNAILASPSAPSSQSSLGGRHLPPSSDLDLLRTKESSGSKNSSNHHVSFEGNRTPSHTSNVHVHPLLREAVSSPSRGLDSTLSRMHHASDPPRPPSIVRVAANSSRKASIDSPISPSAPHSRAASPMRIFNWSPFHRTHTREDPFIPIDPFQLRGRLARFSIHSPDLESGRLPFDPTCDDTFFCCLQPPSCNPKDRFLSFLNTSRFFITDTLPRQLYLYLLLRLPSLYFSRIARIYEDAEVSKPDIQRMIDACSFPSQQRLRTSSPIPPGVHYHPGPSLPFPDEWTTANVSPALVRFKQSWEAFVDSLLREWKTLNLVSALLLSAILSMFQSNEMSEDPVTRTAALLSLTCALMSLSYGCVYIIRFGTMKSMYKATRWAEEAQRTTTFILWNVWVLLAMPAVWLAWSMIFFITAILSFVWRTGSTSDPANPAPLSPTAALGPRIVISAFFLLGLAYFVAIVKTLHNYGRESGHDGRKHIRRSGREAADGQDGVAEREHEHERARGRGRGREREDRDRDRENGRSSRGRERTRRSDRGALHKTERDHERDVAAATEPGGLSAVTGLGLTGLDGFASPRGSDEIAAGEKRRADSLASF